MAKKRRKNITVDKKQIIASAILILSLVIYFHLFFIGEILFKFTSKYISNPLLLLTIIDAYAILILLKLEKMIKIYEIIGVGLIYLSISLIMDKSYLFLTLSKLIIVIVTQNLSQLIYFFIFISGVILSLSRFKNVIFRELNIKIKETNTTLQSYKSKIETKKEQKFEELSKHDLKTYNYITNFLESKNEATLPILKSITSNHISEYANSIYQYIDDLKSTLIKIHSLNEHEIFFSSEDITIDKIKIMYFTKDFVNKKIIIDKISSVITNSQINIENNAWILTINYKSNILISIKDIVVNYVEHKKNSIGISNLGKFVNINYNSNIFINYENLNSMNKFLDIIFLQKTLNGEKFIIIDFKKEILSIYTNKENVLYDPINSLKNLKSLLKYLENDIEEKQNYISDLGYSSYTNFIEHKKLVFEKTNIIFHEITTISIVQNNDIYMKLLNLAIKGHEYGYNFIFTNSKEEKSILESKIYQNTKVKLFFETYSNSFSKLLIKNKLLKSLKNSYAFYIQRNNKYQKVYYPANDLQKNYISNLIGESLLKDQIRKTLLENMWIYDELKQKKLNNEVITLTYVMTKYKIDIANAKKIVNKLNKMR